MEIREGIFHIFKDGSYDLNYKFALNYTDKDNDTLEQLSNYCSCIEQIEAEENRKYNLKQAALAKLTDEECELLGLE